MGLWKKLLAAAAACGLSGQATATDPAFPKTGLFAVEAYSSGPVEPPARPRPPVALPDARARLRSSLEADGFYGAIFEPRGYGSGPGVRPTSGTGPVFGPTSGPVFGPTSGPVFDPVGGPVSGPGLSVEAEGRGASVSTGEERLFGPAPTFGWRVWGGAEVLYGTGQAANVPPLVTTGPAGQGLLQAGALGQPGTVVLFGGRKLLDTWRAGLRAELGLWFDPSHTWGGVARFYSLFSTGEQFVGSGIGTNVLNLPQFFPVGNTVIQLPIYVGFPGVTTGSVTATAETTFGGGDISIRRRGWQGESWRIDGLFGYRQLYLGDQLGAGFTVVSAQLPQGQLAQPGTPVLLGNDDVRTRNHFYGSHVGMIGSAVGGRWMVQTLGSVALGVNVNELDYERSRLATVANLPLPLVQTALSDRTTYFGVVAEGGVRLHFRLTDQARLTFGYTALFWGNLRRAQEQYNLTPTLDNNMSNYLVHTLAWGAEVRY
jgi:hypothetical protein